MLLFKIYEYISHLLEYYTILDIMLIVSMEYQLLFPLFIYFQTN